MKAKEIPSLEGTQMKVMIHYSVLLWIEKPVIYIWEYLRGFLGIDEPFRIHRIPCHGRIDDIEGTKMITKSLLRIA